MRLLSEFIDSVQDTKYVDAPSWFKNWENIGLISWNDKNNDGIIRYEAGNAFKDGRPKFIDELGQSGERMTANTSDMSNQNEVYIDRDIMVLAQSRDSKFTGLGDSISSSWRSCSSTINCSRGCY